MTSGPDVYCKICTQTTDIYKRETITDLDPSTLPRTFSSYLPVTLPYLNQKYLIMFYDYDGSYKSDTYINGFSFNPADLTSYPSGATYSGDEKLSVKINFEWE
ncbi:MAG: hypothetical protein WC868_01635 [Bacteroidales bacterium]